MKTHLAVLRKAVQLRQSRRFEQTAEQHNKTAADTEIKHKTITS